MTAHKLIYRTAREYVNILSKKIKSLLASIFITRCKNVYEAISYLQSYIKNYFLTFHLRPKYAVDIITNSANEIPPNKLAIIIQGPLVLEDNFTIETIKLYNKIFKGAKLILSTWTGEDKEAIEKAKYLGADVITNDLPKTKGYGNINYQLKSTMSGLTIANELKYEFSMKTRADQRLYRHDLFDYFTALIKAFPLKESLIQHERLIVSSFKTCKYRLYSLSDMMMFGDTRDLISYWNADYYEKGIKPYINQQKKQNPPIIHDTPIITEIYLTIKYLEKLGIEPLWTLQHWWSICRDYFCIVDSIEIDQQWPKYKKLYEYWFIKDYSNPNPRSFEFADWLQLYVNQDGYWNKVNSHEFYEYNNDKIVGWEKNRDSGLYVSFKPNNKKL